MNVVNYHWNENSFLRQDDVHSNSRQSLRFSRDIIHFHWNINESIEDILDRSYRKIPILYQSIKQIRLDEDFLVSLNDYLKRLKSNIYNDLIRRETLLRNGKNHTEYFISLLRRIWQISYEQSHEISHDSKHPVLYIMTAIDHILHNHFPPKKALFDYDLGEYISMWLHENLRTIQEDFSIMVECGMERNLTAFCSCIFKKFQSMCAINWERLQVIQHYRLNDIDQSTSIQSETNDEFMSFLGQSIEFSMKTSPIPRTILYLSRTDAELENIKQIQTIFKTRLTKILHLNRNTKPIENTLVKPSSTIDITSEQRWDIHQSCYSSIPDDHPATDLKTQLDTEVNALIAHLAKLTYSSSPSMTQNGISIEVIQH